MSATADATSLLVLLEMAEEMLMEWWYRDADCAFCSCGPEGINACGIHASDCRVVLWKTALDNVRSGKAKVLEWTDPKTLEAP